MNRKKAEKIITLVFCLLSVAFVIGLAWFLL